MQVDTLLEDAEMPRKRRREPLPKLECPECGGVFTRNGLFGHLRFKHDFTSDEARAAIAEATTAEGTEEREERERLEEERERLEEDPVAWADRVVFLTTKLDEIDQLREKLEERVNESWFGEATPDHVTLGLERLKQARKSLIAELKDLPDPAAGEDEKPEKGFLEQIADWWGEPDEETE